MLFGKKKNILDNFSSLDFLQLKKYHPSGDLKFIDLGILQRLKFCVLKEKILSIYFKGLRTLRGYHDKTEGKNSLVKRLLLNGARSFFFFLSLLFF